MSDRLSLIPISLIISYQYTFVCIIGLGIYFWMVVLSYYPSHYPSSTWCQYLITKYIILVSTNWRQTYAPRLYAEREMFRSKLNVISSAVCSSALAVSRVSWLVVYWLTTIFFSSIMYLSTYFLVSKTLSCSRLYLSQILLP